MKFFFNGLIATGMLYGILVVIAFEFFTDFFGSSVEPSSELMAAILGASIGWAGNVLTIHASIEARQNEQLSRDQAVAAEVFVKFQSMVNNFYHFRNHLRESYAAVGSGSQKNPGLFVLSLAGHPDTIHFTPEEKSLFIRLKKNETANDLAQWDDIHNSLVRAFQKYADIREGFMAATPAKMNGTVGTSEFTEEEFKRVAPIIVQLNHLAEQLQVRSEKDYAESRDALLRVKQEMETLCALRVDLILPE